AGHGQQQPEQPGCAPADDASPTHQNAYPTDRWTRKRRAASPQATSTLSGPIGERQRTPTPTPQTGSQSDQRSAALPASTKAAPYQSRINGCWYSRLASAITRPPTIAPSSGIPRDR